MYELGTTFIIKSLFWIPLIFFLYSFSHAQFATRCAQSHWIWWGSRRRRWKVSWSRFSLFFFFSLLFSLNLSFSVCLSQSHIDFSDRPTKPSRTWWGSRRRRSEAWRSTPRSLSVKSTSTPRPFRLGLPWNYICHWTVPLTLRLTIF